MGMVHAPAGFVSGNVSERGALRGGVAAPRPARSALRVVKDAASRFCAGCAAPIEFGAVIRGTDAYCSIECSLGGNPLSPSA
jgi:hypothetical protein